LKVRVTFILEEELVQKFKRFCVEQNGGKFDHGIYSKELTNAIEMLIESKKPREELINLDELEEGIGGAGDGL
jgi:hypothetical protein